MPFPDDDNLPGDGPYTKLFIMSLVLDQEFSKYKLTGDSGAREIEKFFSKQLALDEEYEHKRAIAEDWSLALKQWIDKLEELIEKNDNITKSTYHLILIDKNPTIIEYTRQIFKNYFQLLRKMNYKLPDPDDIVSDRNFINVVKGSIESIADGVAFAVKLSLWKKEQKKLTTPFESEISSIDIENIKPKMLVLRELGIIELLNNRFNFNNTKIAQCLGVILKEKPASIRGILSNISGQTENNTNPENIRSLESAIVVLNTLGCQEEVVKLQNRLSEKLK